jgi:hypothetical protein
MSFSPFVVFGASKSGTTWLQQILDAHPECCCHFQVPVFPMTEELFKKLHTRVYGVLSIGGTPYGGLFSDKDKERQYLWQYNYLRRQSFLKAGYVENQLKGHTAAEINYLTDYHRVLLRGSVEALLKYNTAPAKCYGTKEHTDLEQLFGVFPDAKVISIIRDGRDVVVSKRFHTLRTGVRLHGDERFLLHYWLNKIIPVRIAILVLSYRIKSLGKLLSKPMNKDKDIVNPSAILKYASEWEKTVSYVQEFEQRFPGKVYSVRYESLLSQPETALKGIFRFLGLDDQAETIQQVIEKTAFDKKQSKGEKSFFRKGTSGDWKNYFKPSDKSLFKKTAGKLLIDLGYEPNDQW